MGELGVYFYIGLVVSVAHFNDAVRVTIEQLEASKGGSLVKVYFGHIPLMQGVI